MKLALTPLPCLIALLVLCNTTMAAEKDQAVPQFTSQAACGCLPGWSAFHEKDGTSTGDVWRLGPDGVLVCRGEPKGYIYTEKDYTNFVLTLEWRWPPEKELSKRPGKGGVLFRMTGPNKIWPRSLEAQINAGDVGDFWGLAGYSVTGPTERMKSVEHPQFGKLTNVKKSADAEKPAGQWNTYEIIADGDTVTLIVNGQTLNKSIRCDKTPGKICLTAEGTEIHFRNVRLTPKD